MPRVARASRLPCCAPRAAPRGRLQARFCRWCACRASGWFRRDGCAVLRRICVSLRFHREMCAFSVLMITQNCACLPRDLHGICVEFSPCDRESGRIGMCRFMRTTLAPCPHVVIGNRGCKRCENSTPSSPDAGHQLCKERTRKLLCHHVHSPIPAPSFRVPLSPTPARRTCAANPTSHAPGGLPLSATRGSKSCCEDRAPRRSLDLAQKNALAAI